MIELTTPDGTLKWKSGKLLKGDEAALKVIRQPRAGRFGAVPGLSAERAHKRKDSFLHLVRTIWPNYRLIKDTDSD